MIIRRSESRSNPESRYASPDAASEKAGEFSIYAGMTLDDLERLIQDEIELEMDESQGKSKEIDRSIGSIESYEGEEDSFNSSVSVQVEVDWTMSLEQRRRYTKEFDQMDIDRDGLISAIQIATLFLKTGLPNSDLSRIWNLSDVNEDGFLDCSEFCIARFLLDFKMNGVPLPETLPETMIIRRDWSISIEYFRELKRFFTKSNIDKMETLSAHSAAPFFLGLGISTRELSRIFALADIDR